MPIENYLLNVPDPTQQVLEGLKVGGAIRQQREQRQFESERNEYFDSLSSGLSLDKITQGIKYLDKDQMINVISLYNEMNEEQQQNTLQFLGQTLSAIKANPEVAINMLNTRAEAEKNSGSPENAQEYKDLAEIIKISPETAFLNTAIFTSAFPGGAELIESLGILGKEGREEKKLPGELEQTQADVDKTEAEIEEIKDKEIISEELQNLKVEKAKVDIEKTQVGIEKTRKEIEKLMAQIEDIYGDIGGVPDNIKAIAFKAMQEAFFKGRQIQEGSPHIPTFRQAPVTQAAIDSAMTAMEQLFGDKQQGFGPDGTFPTQKEYEDAKKLGIVK